MFPLLNLWGQEVGRMFSSIQTLWNDFLSRKVLPISSIYSGRNKRYSCMFLEKKNRRASITCWKQKKNRFLLDSYANTTCVNSLVLGLRTGTHEARVRELGLYDPWGGDTV